MKKINFKFADGVKKQIDVCENITEIGDKLYCSYFPIFKINSIKDIFKVFKKIPYSDSSICGYDYGEYINKKVNPRSSYYNSDILEFTDLDKKDRDDRILDVIDGNWVDSSILDELDDSQYVFFEDPNKELDAKIYVLFYDAD